MLLFLLQGWRLQLSRDKLDGRLFPASGGVSMLCKKIDKEKGVVEEYTTYYPQPLHSCGEVLQSMCVFVFGSFPLVFHCCRHSFLALLPTRLLCL